MRILFAVLCFTILFGSYAKADELDRSQFPGKYRLTVSTWWGSDIEAEFLLNTKNELKILGDPYEYHSIEFDFLEMPEFEGPELPIGVIRAGMGSDEDGLAFFAMIAWVGENGIEELKMVNSFMMYMDGPNNVGDVDLGSVKLEKWNKAEKKYEQL